ncbi:hypothetical protein HDU93_007091 [Gonapodya sp. JEL0774]|nr:hypothetical protein HDU93_007091 [Gonapodya sp. JEL0774]
MVSDNEDDLLQKQEQWIFQQILDLIPVWIFWSDMEGNIVYTYDNIYFRTLSESLVYYPSLERLGELFQMNQGGVCPKDVHGRGWARYSSGDPAAIVHEAINIGVVDSLWTQTNGKVSYIRSKSVTVVNNITEKPFRYGYTVDRGIEQELLVKNVELKEALERAEAASHTKDLLLANVSHELRTPLNGLLGMAALLRNSANLTNEQMEFVDAIWESGSGLQKVIEDLLQYSRLELGKITLESTPYSIQSVCDSVVSTLRGAVVEKPAVAFTLEIDSRVPSIVLGDSGRLRQVLLNLVGNALKFTDEGSVRLFVRRSDPGDSDAVQIDGAILFEISDTGIGIPSPMLNRLFKPFSQILQQTANFVGRLEFVEDNPINQKVVVKFLSKVLLVPETAVNGREATEKALRAFEEGDPFDIVLMDIMMPIMSGIEAAQAIRSFPPGFPQPLIIALTANTTERDVQTYREIMEGFISKPIQYNTFITVLEDVLRNRSTSPRPASANSVGNCHEQQVHMSESLPTHPTPDLIAVLVPTHEFRPIILHVSIPATDLDLLNQATEAAERSRTPSCTLPFRSPDNPPAAPPAHLQLNALHAPICIPRILAPLFLDGSYPSHRLSAFNPVLSLYVSSIVAGVWHPGSDSQMDVDSQALSTGYVPTKSSGYTQVASMVRLMSMQLWCYAVPLTTSWECVVRWAVEGLASKPGEEAQESLVVEVGAGKGYWARGIERTARGLGRMVKVVCFDKVGTDPLDEMRWVGDILPGDVEHVIEDDSEHEESDEDEDLNANSDIPDSSLTCFHPVHRGGPLTATRFAFPTVSPPRLSGNSHHMAPLLLLCWPPLGSSMALRALNAWMLGARERENGVVNGTGLGKVVRVAVVAPDVELGAQTSGSAGTNLNHPITATPDFWTTLRTTWTCVEVVKGVGWYGTGGRDAVGLWEKVVA